MLMLCYKMSYATLSYLCKSIPASLKGKSREMNVKGKMRHYRFTVIKMLNLWYIMFGLGVRDKMGILPSPYNS